MRKLPPLNQLKAFEAAGRLGSFRAAAMELYVTDAAISQHIRSLEEFLGAPLFLRNPSGVSLTAAGESYLPNISNSLDQIAAASEQFDRLKISGCLRISVVPSLGSRWLLPRLNEFSSQFPDIQVEPIMSPKIVNLADGEADMAIRHGNGNWLDAKSVLLREEKLVPVASPKLIADLKAFKTEDLLQYPLLAAVARKDEWPHWLKAHHANFSENLRFISYDNIVLAIDAAIAGIGICLVDKALVADDLRQKRLRIVLNNPINGVGAYYIVLPKNRTNDPKAEVFQKWLMAQAKL